jgi:hypothetical protein
MTLSIETVHTRFVLPLTKLSIILLLIIRIFKWYAHVLLGSVFTLNPCSQIVLVHDAFTVSEIFLTVC